MLKLRWVITININKDFEIKKYWDLDLDDEPKDTDIKSINTYIDNIKKTFEESVKLRLRADVPVGVYLSGGLDSSIVAGTVSKYFNGKLKVFTVEFTDDGKFNEADIAKDTAKHIGAEYHSIQCDKNKLLKSFEDCLWKTELPFSNMNCVGKYLLSKLAKEHVKVILTGEGADETFLGYGYFKDYDFSLFSQSKGEKRKKVQKLKAEKRAKEITKTLGFVPLKDFVHTFSSKYQRLISRIFNNKHKFNLHNTNPLQRLKKRIDRSQSDKCNEVRKVQYFSIKGILSVYILSVLSDRQEMAHSIEGRLPFLDHHLFEVAKKIPDKLKINKDVEKYILRETFKDCISETVYKKEKWPYSAPPIWVKKGSNPELDNLMDKYLSKESIENAGIFKYSSIKRLKRIIRIVFFDCKFRRRINDMIIYILAIQSLYTKFKKEFG